MWHMHPSTLLPHVLLGVLQALPGWQLLVLKLLSLQGSKDSVNLCQLAVVPASGDAAQQAGAGAGQQQQQQAPLSQMDELRLLNESVAKQGEQDTHCCCTFGSSSGFIPLWPPWTLTSGRITCGVLQCIANACCW
jgi:hypothetical protein